MKKIFWKITLLSCFISAFAYGGWNELGEGEKVEKTLEGNGKLTTARKLILGKNSHLKIKGENTKGIEIKGGFSPEINIGEGATLDIDIENSKKDEAGLTLVSSTRNFTIQKNGNLKLKKDLMELLIVEIFLNSFLIEGVKEPFLEVLVLIKNLLLKEILK